MSRAAAGWLATALLLAGCAQVREPQGGPKDATPPVLLSADPPNGSVRFAGQHIELQFNERITLDQVRQHLLISPPLPTFPEVAVHGGNEVTIDLNAPLAPNTTYTFNLGDAVKDLSEGNLAAGLAYVVSTGDHLDSLSVHGKVLDAFTGLPAATVLVLLHSTADTGDVRTAPPNWFTRTDADGRFTLAHLPGGLMKLTVLRDQNGNFLYDLPNEDIAFLPASIDPTESVDRALRLFRPLSATQFVVQASVLKDRGWRMVLARPAGDLVLQPLDREGGRLSWWPEWNSTRDSVVFWPSDTTLLAGQHFAVIANGAVLDTLAYRATSKMPYNLTIASANTQQADEFLLTSSRPVASFDTARMELRMDSVRIRFTLRPDSLQRRTLRLRAGIPAGKSATLTLFPKAVRDLQEGTNDTTRLTLGAPDPRSLGQLNVKVQLDSGTVIHGPLVLQLHTTRGGVVREARADSLPFNTKWANLTPGSYGLKLIEDRNNDGAWTTGSFVGRVQPETVHVLADPVVVRAGWAVETDWKVGGKP